MMQVGTVLEDLKLK